MLAKPIFLELYSEGMTLQAEESNPISLLLYSDQVLLSLFLQQIVNLLTIL